MGGFAFRGLGVPFVEGRAGTGPVDLYLGTEGLSLPAGFEPAGTSGGIILERAYRWFSSAAQASTTETERAENLVGAAKALNNLAYWCLSRWEDPRSAQAALDALLTAESITDSLTPCPNDVRGVILLNLGNLLGEAGDASESRRYLQMAQSLGVSSD